MITNYQMILSFFNCDHIKGLYFTSILIKSRTFTAELLIKFLDDFIGAANI
jgi:predicted DNA-binding helix-hairpin-helix protein